MDRVNEELNPFSPRPHTRGDIDAPAGPVRIETDNFNVENDDKMHSDSNTDCSDSGHPKLKKQSVKSCQANFSPPQFDTDDDDFEVELPILGTSDQEDDDDISGATSTVAAELARQNEQNLHSSKEVLTVAESPLNEKLEDENQEDSMDTEEQTALEGAPSVSDAAEAMPDVAIPASPEVASAHSAASKSVEDEMALAETTAAVEEDGGDVEMKEADVSGLPATVDDNQDADATKEGHQGLPLHIPSSQDHESQSGDLLKFNLWLFS